MHLRNVYLFLFSPSCSDPVSMLQNSQQAGWRYNSRDAFSTTVSDTSASRLQNRQEGTSEWNLAFFTGRSRSVGSWSDQEQILAGCNLLLGVRLKKNQQKTQQKRLCWVAEVSSTRPIQAIFHLPAVFFFFFYCAATFLSVHICDRQHLETHWEHYGMIVIILHRLHYMMNCFQHF